MASQTQEWLKGTKRKQRRGKTKESFWKKEKGDLQIRGKGWRLRIFSIFLIPVWDLWLQKAGQVSTRRSTRYICCAVTHAEPLVPHHGHVFLIQWAHPPQKCSRNRDNPSRSGVSPSTALLALAVSNVRLHLCYLLCLTSTKGCRCYYTCTFTWH